MTKRIHLIRHGQSTFNAHYEREGVDPMHFDARLTEVGRQQVAAARAMLDAVELELIVTSPLTRAIETTIGLFGDRNVPILVEALHRECLGASCDVGRSPAELAAEFAALGFDHLPEIWWHDAGERDPAGFALEPHDSLTERIAAFRDWLASRPERAIAVVGHGTFFFHLTGRYFANCEVVTWHP